MINNKNQAKKLVLKSGLKRTDSQWSGWWKNANKPLLCLFFTLTIWLSIVFVRLPGLDLAASSGFTNDLGKFFQHRQPLLEILNDAHQLIPVLLVPVLLLTLLLGWLLQTSCWLRPHKALFILSSYAIGIFVMTQNLQALTGRSRPDDIIEFGGQSHFSPLWHISSNCLQNCSFPSGNAATAVALLSLIVAVPERLRNIALLTGIVYVVIISLNGLIFGMNFLSDIVLAWLLMAQMLLLLWPFFQHNAAAIDGFCLNSRLK